MASRLYGLGLRLMEYPGCVRDVHSDKTRSGDSGFDVELPSC